MKKLRVGIIFGGKSTEHEVSLQSARNIIAKIDREKFEPVLIAIDKQGKWFLPQTDRLVIEGGNMRQALAQGSNEQSMALVPESRGTMTVDDPGATLPSLDVVFPVLHGGTGEDGSLQGLLKMANIPFVGASVLGSAVGMDKDVMKRLLRDAGILVAKFLTVKKVTTPSFVEATAALGLPLFVKPANAGSSVGVHRVETEEEYQVALQDAFLYDTKVLLEEAIVGREIEVAVLGNEDPEASVPGEILPKKDFYSYSAKYLDADGAGVEIPATLSEEVTTRIQELAIKTFQTLSCEGLGRVDFFLKENGEILVNEINTLPGFTAISMYPKLWEATGVSYTELITRLIELALERYEREKALRTSYRAS